MKIFTPQQKNTLLDYLSEVMDKYKVQSSSNPGDIRINLTVGNKVFTINTQQNKTLNIKGVLNR